MSELDDLRGEATALRQRVHELEAALQAQTAASADAQQQLQETTRMLTALVQSSPAAIGMFDLDGVVKLWNPAAERILGYSAAEVVGRRIPAVADGFPHRIVKEIRQGSVFRGEIDVRRRKDGSAVEVSVFRAPLYDADGELIGAAGILVDMTEQRALERQVFEAQKMEAVGRLAGGIAHDFNNILAAIMGFAGIIREELRAGDPICDDIDEILRASDRAAVLTRQLLAFGRRQVLKAEVLDLNELVTNVQKMLARLIGEDVQLDLSLDPSIGHIKADAGQLEQVLMNLVINARDAMPDGGTLTIATGSAEVGPNGAEGPDGIGPGPYSQLIVTDTGTGMSPEILAQIFEPFFSTKPKGKGTGLGLATVYGIIRQSGGGISVHSQPDVGTTFEIFLPCTDENALAVDAPEPAGTAQSAAETILVVEDENAVRRLACEVLRRRGYRALPAANGGEALLLCEHHEGPIDLVLSDVVMPTMNGHQLAERLRAVRPGLHTVFMSGYSDGPSAQSLPVDSREALLAKPFTPAALLSFVRTALDGHGG